MLIFDLETDGLLKDVTRIHCLSIYDTDTSEVYVYNDQGTQDPIARGIAFLEQADLIAGHNVIDFDLPVIRKFYPWFSNDNILDTLILSRIFHPNLMEVDKRRKWNRMPLQLYGRHSLASYGYRLGVYKGCYGETTDWSEWTQELEDYCCQDTLVTKELCTHFQKYLTSSN
jgi:hypothetical protein